MANSGSLPGICPEDCHEHRQDAFRPAHGLPALDDFRPIPSFIHVSDGKLHDVPFAARADSQLRYLIRVVGTGFFVKPTLVLTNYHVVEGIKFVEMKMFNGMETFGKVVKSDVRLDLALIKVQDQGVPVQFYEGNTIDLGSTLEAIGHPKGLTFSITRGVASAVRNKKSVYAVGGKEVLFVQTDAAINPGNSGGPLFLGQKVVGVNNNKLVGGSEGLGFAIHYSEVAEFMKESF